MKIKWAFGSLAAHRATVVNEPKELYALAGMRAVALHDGPILRSLGVRGIVRQPDEGLLDFDLWAKMLDQRIIATKTFKKPKAK